jgi:uncharacterized membrane protein
MSKGLISMSGRRLLRLVILALCLMPVLMPMGFLAATPQHAYAQSQSVHMDHYDADITINKDGSLDIVETLVAVYERGEFHRGKRFWNTDQLGSITNFRVAEERNGQFVEYRQGSYSADDAVFFTTDTFGTQTEGNKLNLRWVFDYVSNTTKTFRISYHVTGVMRVYEDREEVRWYAVPQDFGAPINASRVRVTVPGDIDTSKVQVSSNPRLDGSLEGNTFTGEANNANNGFQVKVILPKGSVQATKPAWQDAADLKERLEPFINLGLTGAGVLILILGPLWAVRKWYKYGRDLPVSLHSDYVADTPSDLPPGLVGTLLDESADVRDVIATVVDQGRKGNLTINEVQTEGFLTSSKDFVYRQTGNKTDYTFEAMVLNAVFKSGSETKLSDLKNTFYKDLAPIYSEMYGELVRLKYFPEDPSAVRTRYTMGGIGFIVLGALVVGASYLIGGGISLFPMIPAVALGITGFIRMGLARSMPRKTDFGSEEAQKWRAFQRYLEEIQRYTDVQTAADKFQKYLPYAVALGVERQLISQFNSVPAAAPPYYIPYYPVGMYPGGTSMGGSSMGGTGGGGSLDPGAAMQGMSDSFGSAMQGMSDSFTDMINSASSIMTSQPSSSGSSGGGWSSGGGSVGGSSGGGGGGFD